MTALRLISKFILSVTTIRAHFNFRTTRHDFEKSVEYRVPLPPHYRLFHNRCSSSTDGSFPGLTSRLGLEGWLSFIDRTR